MDIPLKSCSTCGREFPPTADYFYRDKQKPGGLHSQCKTCRNITQKDYREQNREKRNEQCRDWYIKNREHHRKKHKEWREKNSESRNEKRRDWCRHNLERARTTNNRRKARKLTLPDALTHEQWQYALAYFNNCCAVCGRQLNGMFHRPAADHWIPLSNPECPGTVAENIVPLCHGQNGCNNAKHDRDPAEWLTETFGKRNAKKILAKIEFYFKHVRSLYA